MPMGLCNTPATHQQHMYRALGSLIGKVCHVYLDDIIIWLRTIDEHWQNIVKVMEKLQEAELYCSSKKTHFFLTEVAFLGHIITADGVKPDPAKVEAVRNWSQPTSAKQVRQFLGPVRYISSFLPHLSENTAVLTPLTKKECDAEFPRWTEAH